VIDKDLIDLLRLYSIKGIGATRIRNLISAFGSAKDVLQAPVQRLIRIQGIEKHIAQRIKENVDEKYVTHQLEYLEKNNIKVLTCWDDRYPPRLKKIYDAPVILFYIGDISVLKSDAVAVVGTRNPSQYGKMVTEKFCRDLVNYNITIVSGLARGVDTVAHRTVVKNGGKTVAVLGCGLDQVYPPENLNLAKQITENGALISEYRIGTIPDPGNFPRRNRIISGLSLGILVSEAGKKSGALITAYQALDQNREVFAIPGPISSGKSHGTNLLIKQGAKLVQETEDVLQEIESQLGNIATHEPQVTTMLEGFEKTVFGMLSSDPMHIDILARQCERTTSEVLSVLLTLEIMGVVKQLSGKMFVKMSA
jgi:DNA processing protein